ncbi:MAG: Molybdate ABC transporter substrate-binding protein [Gammaproteobacteria bacterium]|nr:Molybdate ABC transporter substrate-binding protein [Gammaproteobacteria bacterium]
MLRMVIFLLLCFSPAVMAADPPLVAVASNMTQVMTALADRFQASTQVKIKLSFGSTGNFTRQILQGAPYQVFLAADKKHVDMLRDNGRQLLRTAEFARGRIGFFIPSDSRLTGTTDLSSIVDAIEFENYTRLAIANSEIAPYGLAAEQALNNAGIWVLNRNKLLVGENAAQTVQFSLSGAVDIGIIPASAAFLPVVKEGGNFVLIPETWHQPIEQYLVLLTDTNPNAVRFYDFLLTQESRQILIEYGYTPSILINK